MPAAAGVTTNFTLNAVTPTQIAFSNNGRKYCFLQNLDAVNGVWFAFASNNSVTIGQGHYLGPRQYFEVPTGISVVQGDVSAIAAAGTPMVSWVEE